MARIATLLGRDAKSSNLSCLGIAEGGADLIDLVEKYKAIRSAGGIFKKGKTEVKLSEIRLLATATAGGELKAKQLFR